jgi:hypothetical protein
VLLRAAGGEAGRAHRPARGHRAGQGLDPGRDRRLPLADAGRLVPARGPGGGLEAGEHRVLDLVLEVGLLLGRALLHVRERPGEPPRPARRRDERRGRVDGQGGEVRVPRGVLGGRAAEGGVGQHRLRVGGEAERRLPAGGRRGRPLERVRDAGGEGGVRAAPGVAGPRREVGQQRPEGERARRRRESRGQQLGGRLRGPRPRRRHVVARRSGQAAVRGGIPHHQRQVGGVGREGGGDGGRGHGDGDGVEA